MQRTYKYVDEHVDAFRFHFRYCPDWRNLSIIDVQVYIDYSGSFQVILVYWDWSGETPHSVVSSSSSGIVCCCTLLQVANRKDNFYGTNRKRHKNLCLQAPVFKTSVYSTDYGLPIHMASKDRRQRSPPSVLYQR